MSRVLKFASDWNRARLARRRSSRKKPEKLGVLGIMKNEAMNLEEWIEHYLWQGADRVWLIDNGSDDGSLAIAGRKSWGGRVATISLPEPHRQQAHYWTAFNRFGIREKCEWLLVADLDEFWFCKDGRQIGERLTGFDECDVIYCNWTMFGSSGLQNHPDSLRAGLRFRWDELGGHHWTKYICRTEVVRSSKALGIHKIFGACSSRTITDNMHFQLNHYPIQSREYFAKVKMTRGDVGSVSSDHIRDWAYFEKYDAPSVVPDNLLADQVAALRGSPGILKDGWSG